MPKTLEITISPTGAVSLETKGFQGGECQQASADFEKALGVKLTDHKTREFYAGQSQQNDQDQRLTGGAS